MVEMDARGVSIEGRYTVLLCASLFYFRVPEGLWQDRLGKIRSLGYNAIDVYLPWNFHEPAEGQWDFSAGMRNVGAFLDLAAAQGLYVVARPGPYICSEWDGGGLPAYLCAEGITIRQNNAAYLGRVREWYRRVLPIIAERQVGRGGTVALVQIENELDFYDCGDVRGYLEALRSMARDMGIQVPLIACAGQGDLAGAWGGADGVAPALNLYLDSRLPGLESGLTPYVEHLARLGYPLLVTETGRDVLLLRRLLAAGGKLLGAYNQVGGYDFGFTAGVNNWGNPLSFQTTHYGFDSVVDPFGRIRPDAWEHRALGGLVESLGEALAGAQACRDHGMRVEVAGIPEDAPVLRLRQDGAAGYLVAITNTGDTPVTAAISRDGGALPARSSFSVAARSSVFAVVGLDLAPWGLPGRVTFSSAEPYLLRGGERPVAVFQSAGEAEVCLDCGGGINVTRFDGHNVSRTVVPVPGGRSLALYVVPRAEAWRTTVTDLGEIEGPGARTPVEPRSSPDVRWAIASTRHEELVASPADVPDRDPLHMESRGALRGYALYRTVVPSGLGDSRGIVLHDSADVVSVYLDDRYLGTQVPGGGCAFFRFPADGRRADAGALTVRCEIWGHSNFDDPRMPAIRLGSLRGFSRATLVRRWDRLPYWVMEAGAPACGPYLAGPGSRLTGHVPARYRSRVSVTADAALDSRLVWVEGAECPTLIKVDGNACGHVDRYHRAVDVSSAVPRGGSAELSIEPRKWYASESVGAVSFLQGLTLAAWTLSRLEEPELVASAHAVARRSRPTSFPVSVAPGDLAWLSGTIVPDAPFPCLELTCSGSNLKASVLFNGRLVGRLFLESPARPKMAGGRPDVAYLPSCWFRPKGNEVYILLEAVGGEAACLDRIEIVPVA